METCAGSLICQAIVELMPETFGPDVGLSRGIELFMKAACRRPHEHQVQTHIVVIGFWMHGRAPCWKL